METWWEKFKVGDVPEGVSGDWKIHRFEITKEQASIANVRSTLSFSSSGAMIIPGKYTRLDWKGSIVMSDTFDEICDHQEPIDRAEGNCLVAGLGLGVVVNGCLNKENVEHLTVVEKSSDVIALVESHYKNKFGNRLTIVQDDIMVWKPPKNLKYDMAWFDIWDSICADNLSSMSYLKRRFGRKAKWKGCWKEEVLRNL